jgi:hypothetical protein
MEDWSTYKGKLAVEVRLEKQRQVQRRFTVGDELELVIKVPHYKPGPGLLQIVVEEAKAP